MGAFILAADLEPFATIEAVKAAAMIEDAEAQAFLVAPCLPGLTVVPDGETAEAAAIRLAKVAAVKSILRAAVLRWAEAGTGVVQTQVTGPFSQTVQLQARRSMFWPVEVEQLQGICKDPDAGKVYAVDTVATVDTHAPWCDLMMGAGSCSCGADLAGFPIFGAPA